jgi:aldehyde dehydrogenase (NAD+)
MPPPCPSFLPKLDANSTSFINGEFVKGVEGKTFEVINPSTEEVICSVHEATEKDVDIAVKAARAAFEGEWRTLAPEGRGRLLNKLADLFEQNSKLLAAVESLDNGKAFSMATGDVNACVGTLRYYAGWADKIEGKIVDTNHETFNFVKKEPVSYNSPCRFLSILS